MNDPFYIAWPFSQIVVERIGWVLVHSLWQFTLVALLAGVLVRAMRRSSAGMRYGVLVVAMTLSVAAPVVTWLLLPSEDPASVVNRVENIAPEGASDVMLASEAAIELPTPVPAALSLAAKTRSAPSPQPSAFTETAPSWSDRVKTLLRPWLAWIVAVWSMGVFVCSTRPLLGWYTLRRLRRVGVSTVSDEVLAAMQRVSRRLGLPGAVQLLQSTLAQVPIVVGYFRPVILLPVSLLTSIPAAQLEAILAHELAHVRRHDFAVNLLQTLVETLFFYHPAVWWLSHRVRVEREHCCDDLVVALFNNRVEYGRALLAIEEQRGQRTVLALGATDGSLLSRVRRITGVSPDRTAVRLSDRWPVASVGVMTLCLVLMIAISSFVTSRAEVFPISSNESRRDPLVAELPHGIKVELVGLALMESEPKIWWRPDGSRLDDVPVHDKRTTTTSSHEMRRVLLRVHGLPNYLDVATPGMTSTRRDEAHGSGGPFVRVDGGYAIQASQKTAKIEVGIATQPQSALRVLDPLGVKLPRPANASADPLVEDIEVETVNSVKSVVTGRDEGTRITWISPVEGGRPIDLDLKLIDKDGNTHDRKQIHTNGDATLRQHVTYEFDVPFVRVARFEYRLRMFHHWVTFKNVSIHAGERTDVKIRTASLAESQAASVGRGSPDPALDPKAGLPTLEKETSETNSENGDPRSDPAPGLGEPRRAQDKQAGPRTLLKPAFLLPGHYNMVDVRFDNNDTELVAVSAYHFATVRRCDVGGRTLKSEINLASDRHLRPFRPATFKLSGDGRRVVAATDEYVGIWDTSTGELLKKLSYPTKEWEYDCIGQLDCTPDLSVIVGHLTTHYSRTTQVYDAHLIVWDGNSGEVLNMVIDKHATELQSIALSMDGKLLATTNGGGAKVWETSTGKLLRSFPNDNKGRKHSDPEVSGQYTSHVWSVQLSPDGKQLAVGDILGVRLWDVQLGQLQHQLDAPYRYGTGMFVYSKDGQLLARTGTSGKGKERVVPIWSTQTGEKRFELHTESNCGVFSDDNKQFAVGLSERQMVLAVFQLDGSAADVEPARPSNNANTPGGLRFHHRGKQAEELIDLWKPVWGDEQLGIRYGIALASERRQFRIGQRVPMMVFFRNVSDKTLQVDVRPDFFWNVPKVTSANGAAVELEQIALLGTSPHYREKLEPGEAFGAIYLSIGLGDNPRPGRQDWGPFWKMPVAGQYKLAHSLAFKVASPEASTDDNSDDWKPGQLTSGTLVLEIVDGGERARKDPADEEAAEIPVDQSKAIAEAVAKELNRLQGHWAIDSCESDAALLKVSEFAARRWRWTVKGDEIEWGREGQEWKVNFKLDPVQTPKQIDLTFLDGPLKDQKCLGIYDWDEKDGKTLKILMQDPGAKVDRPTSFARKAGSQTSLIVLHAIPPIDPVKELASFQGTWSFDLTQPWTWPQPIGLGIDSNGRKSEKRWVIEGNRITWVGRDGERIYVTFTIDPFKAPKQIDFTFVNGPHRGQKSIGIYEPAWGNENYRWLCMTDPGTDAPRPTDVSASSFKKQSMIGMHQITPPEKPSAAKALERFQGVWNMTACDSTLRTFGATQQEASKWQWTIKGDEILWSRQGDVWKLKLDVDPSKLPKEMDLTYLSGPFKGAKCLGMYEFGGVDRQSLMIAIQDPGSEAPRPTSISMSGDVKTGLIFLRPSKPNDAEREIASFQGIWTLRNFDTGNIDRNKDPSSWPLPGGKGPNKSGEGSELRWIIKRNEISWTSRSGQEIKASFTIDSRQRPKQINLTFLSGPNKGETCPGLYQRDDLDENILWLCIANPGSNTERPKEFSYEWGKGRSVLSLYPF